MTIRQRRISTRKDVDSSFVDGRESSPLADKLIRERDEIHCWKETVEIRPPNLLVPRQIATHVNSGPLAKLAVSPKCDYIAVMSHRRTFQIFRVSDDGREIVHESTVQILEDSAAEYCLFKFVASGTLLLSTRTDSSIDVFDRLAEHCYTVFPDVLDPSHDLVSSMSSLSSYPLTREADDKFTDYLAALHWNCTLSAYKLGRTSYFKLFTAQLLSPLAGLCRLLPTHGMLLVSTHYKVGADEPPGGLTSYRIVAGAPHLVPVVGPSTEKDWLSSLSARLPFGAFAYVSALTVDAKESLCAAVSSTGDAWLFDLPSLNAIAFIGHVTGPRPRLVEFVHEKELAILFSSGVLVRCPPEAEAFMAAVAAGDQDPDADAYAPRTSMMVPAERELFLLESRGGPEVAISSQRSSLAARLFLLTIWRSLKLLLGMAVGEAAAPLQQATQLQQLEFTLWHAPVITLEELLERTMREGDFERARQLAAIHPEIPSDLVYKRQWRDLVHSRKLREADVKDVLGRVGDAAWKGECCLHTRTPSLEIQRGLVLEGVSLRGVALGVHARLAHHGRILAAMGEDVELYLEMRDRPLMQVAKELAMRGELLPLQRLLEGNWKTLGTRSLSIIGELPASIAPRRYEALLKTTRGEIQTYTTTSSVHSDELERVRKESEEGRSAVAELDGTEDVEEDGELEEWAKSRARAMEAETGLVAHAIEIIELCQARGAELTTELAQWRRLSLFVSLTHSIAATLDFFLSAPPALLVQHFNTLDDSTLLSSLDSIIDLLEEQCPGKWTGAVEEMIVERTTTSTSLLEALFDARPAMLTEEFMLQALTSLNIKGVPLLEALAPFPVPEKITSVLRVLGGKGVTPTFGAVLESERDAARARQILSRVLDASQGAPPEAWRNAARDVVSLARLLYSSLLSEEEALEMVVERFCLDDDACPGMAALGLLMHLAPGHPTADARLGSETSAQLLLRMANSFVASAMSGADQQLGRARLLADAAKEIAPKDSSSLLRSLDSIILAADLGCSRLPIQILHADPPILLNEVIAIGENYTRGKRCARLAQLLRVETPVATAFAACAIHAVERGDERTLEGYIKEVSSARHLAVVHRLAMSVLATPLLPTLRSDLEAIALANAGEEELEGTLKEIERMDEEQRKKEEEERRGDSRSSSPLMMMMGGRGRMGSDPSLCPSPPPLSVHAPLDPFYTRAEQEERGANEQMGEEERRRGGRDCGGRSLVDATRRLASESASTAVAMSLLLHEGDEWTGDEQLKRYSSALRHFLPVLGSRLAQRIPPRALIARAIAFDGQSTAIDRLDNYGCERERFVEDAQYRLDTVDGLAMMEESSAWQDALELAASFAIDPARIHLASLENILTTLPVAEARAAIAERGHLDVLQANPETLHAALRKGVLPLIGADDDASFLLYLEQFTAGSTEATMLPLVRYFQSHGVTRVKGLLGDESRLARVLRENVAVEDVEKVAAWLQELPGTSSACEAAARTLLSEKSEPRRFLPLLSSPALLLELLEDISLNLEADIKWLIASKALSPEWSSTLKEHLDEMGRRERQWSATPSQGDSTSTSTHEDDALFEAFDVGFGRSSQNLTQRRRGH